MSTQLNIFLLLFGGLQGLLFGLFLFRKKLHQNGYIFLLFYLGIMLMQLTLKVMNKLWLMDNWSLLYSLSHYLPLLYGPLAYLFIKQLVERRSFNRKELFHFLPVILTPIAVLLSEFNMTPAAVESVLYNPHIRLSILFASLISYHSLAYRCWQKRRLPLEHYFSDTRFIQMKWMRHFVLLSFIVCGLVVTALYLLYINYPSGHKYRYGFAGLTFFMYWISYTALKQPVIFSVIKGYAETDHTHTSNLVVHRQVKKYASSTLDANEKKRISEGLDTVIKEDKIYLDSELTSDRLAKKVGCSRHALSQVLNECMQQSFYDYINLYRVEEAKMLLVHSDRKAHKIASIGYDAGFNSLSTFNDAFKKYTGCTPSQFRRRPEEYSNWQRVFV